ncbi:hypothetical protein E2562_025099 [Oryza meyeriana var. granulata]|uniref:Uncharacterized protein n=1 Tax=Oryza meyeriana var. granulata TaxID=110450 RepID=A0A6G1CJA9_9ORYZ|nr:hypothetical protein E2562_025099 [Oryza meyeriana var. granulata]
MVSYLVYSGKSNKYQHRQIKGGGHQDVATVRPRVESAMRQAPTRFAVGNGWNNGCQGCGVTALEKEICDYDAARVTEWLIDLAKSPEPTSLHIEHQVSAAI